MAYAMFWGCQIPARLPFIEKSIRLVLERLETPHQDLEGFTCCPERELIRTASEELWYVAGTRNLALAEAQGLDILTPCNGCYSTQKDIIHQLKRDLHLREEVNRVERSFGLEYRGKVKVQHLVEYLHDDLGLPALGHHVRQSLSGMRVAVHNGCHLLRPNPAITFDDPIAPIKFDAIVGTMGGRSVAHSTKMLCCGQGYNSVEEPQKSQDMVAQKLEELHALGVKALVTCCPMCFIQYDWKQAVMRRQGSPVHVPVLYLSELIGLVMGISPEEMSLEEHRTDVSPFFEEWRRSQEGMATARQYFDLTIVDKCYRCGGCLQDCPGYKEDPTWNPQEIMGRILAGEIEELVASRDPWQCLDCFTCDELCPQRWSWRQAFETLRHLAIERGYGRRGAQHAFDLFRRRGRLIEATATTQALRARLGLAPAPGGDGALIGRLLEAAHNHHAVPEPEPQAEISFLPPEEEEEPEVDG